MAQLGQRRVSADLDLCPQAPVPKNHRALRQLAEIGEQRLVLLLHWKEQRHVLVGPGDLAIEKGSLQERGRRRHLHVGEPPEPVVSRHQQWLVFYVG